MAVDFVKSNGGKDKPKQSGYAIEYTNPSADRASDQPKQKHGNVLDFFQKKPAEHTTPSVRAIHELPQQPTAVSATAPILKPERHLPPAPPPPAIPTRPTLPPPPPKPPITPAKPSAPTLRTVTSVPTQPITPTPPATPAPHHATSVGQIIAQNVSGMRGASTDPVVPYPSLVDLNLLPNAISQPLHRSGAIFRLFRVTTLTVMLFTVVYLALVCYQAFFVWRTHTALTELATLDATILSYRTLQNDINTSSDTLLAIQQLLDEHIYWTQWFSFLEQYTLPTVYYVSFSGSNTGAMSLDAVAPDYNTIAQQIAVLQGLPEVQSVTVATATRSVATVRFTISLQMDPNILHYGQ